MARVTVTLTGDEQRLIRSLNKVIAKEKELATQALRTGEATERGARKAEAATKDLGGAIGDSALTKLTALGTGFLSFGKAVDLAKGVVDGLIESFNRQQQAVDRAIGDLNRFAAISALKGPAAREAVLGLPIAATPEQKAQIAFAAQSAGIEGPGLTALAQQAEAARVLGEDPVQFTQRLVGLKGGALGQFETPQIASFLQAQAARSPLDIGGFAESFARVSGVAGQTPEEIASAGAVLSAQTQALGGAERAQQASTALVSVLARRGKEGKGGGANLLGRLGVAGKTIDQQIFALSEGLAQGRVTSNEINQAFGLEAGAKLQGLLRSPEAIASIAPATAAGIEALRTQGPSTIELSAREALVGDRQRGAVVRRQRAEAELEAARARRGFEQAGIGAEIAEAQVTFEARGAGFAPAGALVTALNNLTDVITFPLRKELELLTGKEFKGTNELLDEGLKQSRQQAAETKAPALGATPGGATGDVR